MHIVVYITASERELLLTEEFDTSKDTKIQTNLFKQWGILRYNDRQD
ncbi:hypothetical protein YK48G_05120 [Lentilactobacillus fungorum]|uniref:Uncharacterized protein n=1 Tax=Lentilactobacillus fungorum TaxID=2201250 RepID=A0ABQ3VW06_9LACO|nr:hypothetical protein YK48G_05120 [Lentilactobacillus fungorum]